MLAEGKNVPVPRMPFDQLCDLIAEAIKSVSPEKVIKTFKQTLLSLPIDGSRDQAEGSKRLPRYIAGAPSLDQIPEKCRSHVTRTMSSFYIGEVAVDADGIRRRNSGAAEKYKNRVFTGK